MSNQIISDFTDEQLADVQLLVNQAFSAETELQLGDGEIPVDSKEGEIIKCPVIYWSARGCHFIMFRMGENQYRAQYFYNPQDLHNTQQTNFTDVTDCATALLREHANYESKQEIITQSESDEKKPTELH